MNADEQNRLHLWDEKGKDAIEVFRLNVEVTAVINTYEFGEAYMSPRR